MLPWESSPVYGIGMKNASIPVLEVSDLEYVPERPYIARHGCGASIIGWGYEMPAAVAEHTESYCPLGTR